MPAELRTLLSYYCRSSNFSFGASVINMEHNAIEEIEPLGVLSYVYVLLIEQSETLVLWNCD